MVVFEHEVNCMKITGGGSSVNTPSVCVALGWLPGNPCSYAACTNQIL